MSKDNYMFNSWYILFIGVSVWLVGWPTNILPQIIVNIILTILIGLSIMNIISHRRRKEKKRVEE